MDIDGFERELSGALEDIMLGETRLWLLKTILSLRLVTWDIYYFAVKQADLRDNMKTLDWPTMRAALKAKIRDVKLTLTKNRKRKSHIERKISMTSLERGDGSRLRETMKRLLEPIRKKRRMRLNKFETKIEHYRKKQHLNEDSDSMNTKTSSTRVPNRLAGYSGLKIFNGPKDLPKPKTPVGPFVGSKDIFLSPEERTLLSKDPKYSLRYSTNFMEFQIELERMGSKQRYGQGCMDSLKKKKGGDLKIKTVDVKEIHQALEREKEQCENPKDERITALEQQWNSMEKSLVYDPLNNRINFNNRRVTDYKHNKKVTLPGPMSSDLELEWELRRKLYVKTFNQYSNKERIQSDMNDAKKSKKDILNLNKKEQKGLKSLLKRIKNDEIMITTTDKSGRLAVLTKKQYFEAGECHTKKDCQIGWNEVKYLQGQINSHTWWLSSIVGNSLNTNPERVNKNIHGSGCEVPELSLLVKDHKGRFGQTSPDETSLVR